MKRFVCIVAVVVSSVLLILSGCADRDPPSWPEGAELTAEAKGGTVSLSWPAPTDAGKIAGFEVSRGEGASSDELGGDASSFVAKDLPGMTELTFSVTARDEAGNDSEPLRVTVKTGDATAPTWPEERFEASLPAQEETKGVRFAWGEAADDVGVKSYVLSKGGEEKKRLPSSVRDAFIEGDALEGEWSLAACDAEGNCSEGLTCKVDMKTLEAKKDMLSSGIFQLLGATQMPEVFRAGKVESALSGLLGGQKAPGMPGLGGLSDPPGQGGLGLGELRAMDEELAKEIEKMDAEKDEEKKAE